MLPDGFHSMRDVDEHVPTLCHLGDHDECPTDGMAFGEWSCGNARTMTRRSL
jgi:hypothetical protein